MKPFICEVLYTATDETYYAYNCHSKYENIYPATSLGDLQDMLQRDGWRCSGGLSGVIPGTKVWVPLRMYQRDRYSVPLDSRVNSLDDIIAIGEYDETIYNQTT